ncbi:hypothetical protein J6TS1_19950 [Siminovitchia terrae]|uniref:DUF4935 domain-containing protein n=1 Tax=Siminovitchia terrae TaxID=1914933 RepID=A0ABQ4KW00_SIMTE|nr:PIN domain-containing protein [Siminovitchia terrae]GIN96125.1 hypothetical protein J6TS1_19950 [Siminovitchia terrae]
MSYLIILDTNIIYNDFHFKSNAIKKLLKYTNHEPVQLCITEFNYNEVIKKYRDNVRPIIKNIKNNKKDLINLEIADLVDFKKLNANFYVERYKEYLRKIINENNITLIGYPEDEKLVEKISTKYFDEIKPFGENKVSFQDAIIWESILEYYNRKKPDSISNNHKDFANKEKTEIHEDIQSEIPEIRYHNSLKSFLDKEEDNLKDYFIDNYEYDEKELKEGIRNYFESYTGYERLDYSVHNILMNSDFEGEYISGWGTDGHIESYEIELLDITLDIEENVLLIDMCLELEVSFSIETIDPTFEKGDTGDGMISESSSNNILIYGDITYSLGDKEVTEYVEKDIEL